MKTKKYISTKFIAVIAICLALPFSGMAQKKGYFDVDWQFNVPLGEKFAGTASGWGMNFEGGYYVIPSFSVGAFIAYHTNNKYIGEETLQLNSTTTLTTDQQHSVFQLPFGAAFRYRMMDQGIVQPYIGLKLGAQYSKMTSYYNVFETRDKNWGFYTSPEIGMSIFPSQSSNIGFHVALYYSFATNKGNVLTYSIDHLNNFGFRLGVEF